MATKEDSEKVYLALADSLYSMGIQFEIKANCLKGLSATIHNHIGNKTINVTTPEEMFNMIKRSVDEWPR